MAKILVVDDEPSMREFLEILLRQQGHEVVSAADLSGALALAAAGGLDLVVSDLRLGKDSGLSLLERVKQASPWRRLAAVETSCPRLRSMISSISRMEGSSSTTRIRAMAES